MQLIFDIGSNTGSFSASWSTLYPECMFVCVEPNIDFLLLYKDTAYNNCNNYNIIPHACSNTDNQLIEIYTSELFHTLSTCNEKWVKDSRFNNLNANWKLHTVKTITIDTLIEKYGIPDYIKIDVEGHELQALNGLTVKVPLLSFEWAEELNSEALQCIYRLRTLGFEHFYIKESDDYTYIPPQESFYSFDSCKRLLETLDSARKERWGLVFAR